jgi:hypothetical protein
MAYPACAKQMARAARDFILPEVVGAPISLYSRGGR